MFKHLLIGFLLSHPLLQSGDAALQARDYTAAAAAYQSYLESIDPAAHAALSGLARSQALAGDYDAALSSYNQLLTLYPDDLDARFGRGQVYSWQQDFTAAEADLQAVISQAPDYADAWQALANVYRWSGQNLAAAAHFSAWQAAFAEAPVPWLAQAEWELARRQFTAARSSLAQAEQRGANSDTLSRLRTRLNRLPGALPWEAQLQYAFDAFVGDQTPWHSLNAGLQYTFEQGAVALQSLSTYRFDRWDQAIAAESWLDLWPGAYGNFRLQASPVASVLPRWDGLGEVYQTFGDWEVSALYRLMAFPAANVHFFSGGLGTYLGNWYLRAQPMLFLSDEGPGGNVTLWARYFFDTADDFIELRAGLGRRIAIVGAGPALQGQTNAFGLLTAQHFITPHIGLIGSLNYNYDDAFADRYGLSLGTRLRW